MTEAEKRQIKIAVAVQDQPDGTYHLTNDMGVAAVEVKSIDDALEIVNAWAKIRASQEDALGVEIVVEFSYPVLTFH